MAEALLPGMGQRLQSSPQMPIVTVTIKLEPGQWLDGMRRVEELERLCHTRK